MKLFIVLFALVALGSADLQDVTGTEVEDNGLHALPEAETTGLPEAFRINNIPDGYHDSTHQVHVVNGMRIEVNETVTKSSDEEDGALVAQILIKVLPAEVSEVDGHPAGEITGDLPSDIKNRHRRELLEYVTRVSGNANCRNGAYVDTPSVKAPAYRPTPAQLSVTPAPISYIGDTDVNYIGVVPRDNPDAEIFDANLVREDANRFFARRPQPVSSPFRAQPIRSQPIRSHAQWSHPIRSQPLRTQSVYSHSVHSQTTRTHPVQAQPLVSQFVRSQQLRSQPIQSQPLRSQPIYSQPLRSQPIHSQPIRSQAIRSQPLVSQPIRAEPLTTQPIRSQTYSSPRL